MSNETITIRLSPRDVDLIDKRIEDGHFTSRSDAIRYFIRHVLNDMEERESRLKELEQVAQAKGITKDSSRKAVKKARKEVHEEIYEK
jgi:Arc/MetJ-type ribon-helix-helix transcriptional regulator